MASTKRKNKTYTEQFTEETEALVIEQGYTVIEAAEAVNVRSKSSVRKTLSDNAINRARNNFSQVNRAKRTCSYHIKLQYSKASSTKSCVVYKNCIVS